MIPNKHNFLHLNIYIYMYNHNNNGGYKVIPAHSCCLLLSFGIITKSNNTLLMFIFQTNAKAELGPHS